jgi:hypothetical protein
MALEPTNVLLAVSTVSAAIFLLVLPVRLWKLRKSSIGRTSTWQGLLKAVSIPDPQDSSSTSHKITTLGSWGIAIGHIGPILHKAFKLGCAAQDLVFGLTVCFYACCLGPEHSSAAGATAVS